MTKLKNKILRMNFAKFFRRFVIATLLAVLVGGIATGIAFRTQISEAVTYVRSVKAEGQKDGAENHEWLENLHGHEHGGAAWESHIPHFSRDLLTKPTKGAKIVLGVFGLLCVAAFGIYWLTVAAWLYQSAEKAGLHGLLWFLLALGSNLFAVILFLLIRSFLREKCAGCGKWQNRKNKFCVSCGAAMLTVCPGCETVCKTKDAYCSGCGRKLQDAEK